MKEKITIKCIYCFGAGREIITTPIITFGKFGIFKKKTRCCIVCYGKGRVYPQVLFDLEQDCRTFH